MLQYSIYSVISPEGCASILYKSADKAEIAAEAMGITAERLHRLKLVDDVVPEPLGGAHRDSQAMADTLKHALAQTLAALQDVPIESLLVQRRKRLAGYGVFKEG
jgi:acetyl-CoA carboxylase carboxyl transferase subunit alpha